MMKEITPEYIRGLIDGEGCFEIVVSKRSSGIFGFQIHPEFRLTLTNIPVLKKVREYFRFGRVYEIPSKKPEHSLKGQFVVLSLEDLERLKEFFEEHPPIVKEREFQIWSRGVVAYRRLVVVGRRGIRRERIQVGYEKRREAFLELMKLREESKRRKRKITSATIISWMGGK